jgi:hypothetical protein
MHEAELDRLSSQKLQLEMQINTLESANINAETMAAMKQGAEALKAIHGKVYVTLFYFASFSKAGCGFVYMCVCVVIHER